MKERSQGGKYTRRVCAYSAAVSCERKQFFSLLVTGWYRCFHKCHINSTCTLQIHGHSTRVLVPDSLTNHDFRCTCLSQSRIASVSYECCVLPTLNPPPVIFTAYSSVGRKVGCLCYSDLSLWEKFKRGPWHMYWMTFIPLRWHSLAGTYLWAVYVSELYFFRRIYPSYTLISKKFFKNKPRGM
jgi:hypothetical protein